jgi:zinc transporter ZupT
MVGFTTLVGILVHSAADGIALGAAAFADNAATGALISLAIILHKVPPPFTAAGLLGSCLWFWPGLCQCRFRTGL